MTLSWFNHHHHFASVLRDRVANEETLSVKFSTRHFTAVRLDPVRVDDTLSAIASVRSASPWSKALSNSFGSGTWLDMLRRMFAFRQ